MSSQNLSHSLHFTPTRAAGLQRMAAFAPRMGAHYKNHRNYDYGPDKRTNVSALSPYIRHRMVSEAEAAEAALSRFSLSSAEKFVQEICWRTYWKGWLERRPGVWRSYRDALAGLEREAAQDGDLRRRYMAAVRGDTGIDCFDAWARELDETGYLHNHARMWFASIWIYTLGLPWQLGADFFLKRLIDGDPASNTLSWRWVCGLHTVGKTYLARADNIARYVNGRFNPAGLLAKEAPPLRDEPLAAAAGVSPLPRIKEPAPDKATLIMTEDDWSPRDALPPALRVTGVIALDPQALYAGHGEPARAFKRGAFADAVERAAADFACEVETLPADAPAATLAARVRAHGAAAAVTPYWPVGLQRNAMPDVRAALASEGVRLHEAQRAWDEAFWPHAGRGFFQLKEKIPDVLRALSIPAGEALDLWREPDGGGPGASPVE